MTIKVGDRLPDVSFMTPGEKGPEPVSTADVFGGKTVALFSVPGAFTPTCDARHLPSFKDAAKGLKAKGVDTIACVSVNDVFVMKAWGKASDAGDMLMLADGNGDFAKATGTELDGSKFGMGHRSQRYSMLVEDGVVKQFNLEAGGAYEVSGGDYLLAHM